MKDPIFWPRDSVTRCPRCDSPAPHLHPAVQHEGEVQPCPDPFHERETPENTAEKIAEGRRIAPVADHALLVRAFEHMLGARLGHSIELDYDKHFTADEFEHLSRRLDELTRGRVVRADLAQELVTRFAREAARGASKETNDGLRAAAVITCAWAGVSEELAREIFAREVGAR